jgi:hypothetical protein
MCPSVVLTARRLLLGVSALALFAGCGPAVSSSGTGGSTDTSGSSSSSSSGGAPCGQVSTEWLSDGSFHNTATCDMQSVAMDCGQIGLSTDYDCSCVKDGVALGKCQTSAAAAGKVVGTCCDKYFFPPPGCLADGKACSNTAECCFSVCSSAGACGCLENATACQLDTDCCTGVCNHLGQCGCLIDGTSCQDDAECCGQSCDASTGTCITTCQPKGGYCQTGGDCCSSYCNGNICK